MAREVLLSVVLIRAPGGFSSGVVLDAAGHILTNARAVGGAATLDVLAPGDPAPRTARVVGSHPPDDLAVIRADNPCGLQPARFGDSDRARAGDVVLAVSNGLGSSGSVTEGTISAAGRAVSHPDIGDADTAILREAIQTSTPVTPGHHGGALVNAAGQVIGIPTLAVTPHDGPQSEGTGMAIPSNLARDTASEIIASGRMVNAVRAAIGAPAPTVTIGSAPHDATPS